MKDKHLKLLIIILGVILPFVAFAQNYDKSLIEQVAPVEPTAASLGKYGTYPVNYSTGLVPITIPLYEIKSGDLTQTIQLNYHGGGIRVSEEATWVGLGWDLDFGGVINRTMNGFPDEEETQPVPEYLISTLQSATNFTGFDFYKRFATSETPYYSFKPDLFSYNFGNYSGTFFSSGTTLTSISHSAIKGTMSSVDILLQSPTGVSYKFIAKETTTLHGALVKNAPYTSGYYIGQILSANRTDTINYAYQTDGTYHGRLRSVAQGYTVTNGMYAQNIAQNKIEYIPETSQVMFTQWVNTNKPRYIYFNGGRITFNLSERTDVDPNYSNRIKKLDNIQVESLENGVYSIKKNYQFYYSYFNQGADYNSLRLCLDSVVENPYSPTEEKRLVASFEYYGNKTLPSKESYSFDYWGFNNGKNNSSPIPLTITSMGTFGGADKTPDPNFAQMGSIKSIQYPTKGKTEFIWEGNRVNSDTPIYDVQKTTYVSLVSESSPLLTCYPSTPNPDDELGVKCITIHSYINQSVKLSYYLYKMNQSNLTHNKYDKGSIMVGGETLITLSTNQATQSKVVYLQANQDYTFCIVTNCNNIAGSLWFNYNAYDPNPDKNNYPFAGIRIKDINSYGNNELVVSKKSYKYLDNSNHSSGYITNNRNLSYQKTFQSITAYGFGQTANQSSSATQLYFSTLKAGIEANNFGYENVQEYSYSDGVNNGYTTYQFAKGTDNYIDDDTQLITKSHLRGQLIHQTDYKRTETTYQIAKETFNYYSRDPRVSAKKQGFSMQININFKNETELNTASLTGLSVSPGTIFIPKVYDYTSDWIKLDSTVTKNYFESSSPLTTKTFNYYGNEKHLQPTELKTYANNGDVKLLKTVYPSDDNSAIAGEMIAKNMLLLPLDIKEYILKNGTDSNLVDGYNLTYEKISNNILLTKVSGYLPNRTSSVDFQYSYNNRSRLIETTGKDGMQSAIIWDPNNYYPLVIGKNISYGSLSGALQSVNNNPSSLYTSTNSAVKQAQITAFTYFPLIGIKTKTDPRGITTYYNYDGLGRLINIKNNDNQILNTYDYHYK
jgi:YD repeat-containing protein